MKDRVKLNCIMIVGMIKFKTKRDFIGKNMTFLNPTSDIAFKKLFGNAEHKNVVMSFLNNILGRAEGEKIVDVTFGDTHNHPKIIGSKASIVDVKCFDQKGIHYIIEMQVATEYDYTDRALYYSSIAISGQLQKKDIYEKLMPVIFVGILNFNLFETPRCISHHFITDSETKEHTIKGLEFHFIELKKFNKKKEEELVNELEKWIYFLKEASGLEEVPKALKQSPAITEAFDILKRGNWSRQELAADEDYWKGRWSERSQLKTAKIEEKRDIAKSLLQENVSLEIIARTTGLSIDEIKIIKKNIL